MSSRTKAALRDQEMVRLLEMKATLTSMQLAKETKTSELTIRRRVAKLKEKGILHEELRVSPDHSCFPVRALISIDLHPPSLTSERYGYKDQQTFCAFLREGLRKQPEFLAETSNVKLDLVTILLGGRCDLMALVAAGNTKEICDFA